MNFIHDVIAPRGTQVINVKRAPNKKRQMRPRAMLVAALLMAIPVVGRTNEPAVSDVLQTISKEINKTVPLKIDGEKVLETTVALFDTLIFKYKFTDERAISNPSFDKSKYLAALRISLGESTCMDASVFALLKRGAKYTYIFTTKRGLQLFEYTLDERECANYRRKAKR